VHQTLSAVPQRDEFFVGQWRRQIGVHFPNMRLRLCRSSQSSCHNQTDPLPLSERGGPNTAQIDVVLSVPSAPSGPASRFFPHRLFPSQLHLQTEATYHYGSDSRRNGLATAPASKALWPDAADRAQRRRLFAPGHPGSAQLRPWSRRSQLERCHSRGLVFHNSTERVLNETARREASDYLGVGPMGPNAVHQSQAGERPRFV